MRKGKEKRECKRDMGKNKMGKGEREHKGMEKVKKGTGIKWEREREKGDSDKGNKGKIEKGTQVENGKRCTSENGKGSAIGKMGKITQGPKWERNHNWSTAKGGKGHPTRTA